MLKDPEMPKKTSGCSKSGDAAGSQPQSWVLFQGAGRGFGVGCGISLAVIPSLEETGCQSEGNWDPKPAFTPLVKQEKGIIKAQCPAKYNYQEKKKKERDFSKFGSSERMFYS